MAGNTNNLKRLTSEEARKNGSKGGKASVEARREKKKLRECAEIILSLPVTDTRKWNKMAKMGLSVEDIDNRMLMIAALIIKAQSGDVSAAKEVRDLIGETGDIGDSNTLNKAKEILEGVDSGF